jgi:hypothetical protein
MRGNCGSRMGVSNSIYPQKTSPASGLAAAGYRHASAVDLVVRVTILLTEHADELRQQRVDGLYAKQPSATDQ